jgi:hypothetical protein
MWSPHNLCSSSDIVRVFNWKSGEVRLDDVKDRLGYVRSDSTNNRDVLSRNLIYKSKDKGMNGLYV